MNIKPYDAQEEARLVSLADAKETQRQSIAKQMHDVLGRDPEKVGNTEEPKVLNTDELMRYKTLELHEQTLSREVKELRAEVEAMQITKPIANADRVAKEDPLLRWIKKGNRGLDQHELKDQEEYADSMGLGGRACYVDPIFRAVSVPASTGNAKTLDETVVQSVIEGLHAFGGSIQAFTVAMTPDGNTIKYPLYDDVTSGSPRQAVKVTGNIAAQQETAITETTLENFDDVQLEAFIRNTGFLDISRYWNEDVNWNVGDFVRRVLRRRMGRTIEEELTNGGIAIASGLRSTRVENIPNPTGAFLNEPAGFVVRAGKKNYSSPSATKGDIKWQDLNTLIHDIDQAYLMGEMGLYGYSHRPGRVGFMVNWVCLGELKNIADTQNRPIVLPSVQSANLSTMFGYPIFVNLELRDSGFDGQWQRPIYFGNWGYMAARFAGAGFAIEEHYDSVTAPTNANRYLGRIRYDADYIGVLDGAAIPKAPAIKCLVRNVA